MTTEPARFGRGPSFGGAAFLALAFAVVLLSVLIFPADASAMATITGRLTADPWNWSTTPNYLAVTANPIGTRYPEDWYQIYYDGSFYTLSVPAGTYDLVAGSMSINRKTQTMTVAEGETLEVNFDLMCDVTAPVTDEVNLSSATWYRSAADLQAQFVSTDDLTGVFETVWWVNSQSNMRWHQFIGGADPLLAHVTESLPVNLSTHPWVQGENTLYYYSRDCGEYWTDLPSYNVETAKSKTIRLDWTPPTTTLTASPSGSLFVTAVDSLSGVESTFWRVAGEQNWRMYSAGQTLPEGLTPGTHSIEYYSTDDAGNAEGVKSTQFSVELVADDYESDDSFEMAKEIVADGPAQYRTLTEGDGDFIRLDAVAGVTYSVDRFGTGFVEGMNWVTMQLLDDQWNVLAESPPNDWSAQHLEWTAGSTGPVYLCVSEYMSGSQDYWIRVTANHAPSAIEQSATTIEGTPVEITLSGTDVDGDALTYEIVTPPSNGTISPIIGNRVTYTPYTDHFGSGSYHGSDSFTFRAYDGTTASSLAAVSLTVTPVGLVADDYEPDGSVESAKPILPDGLVQHRTLWPDGDADFIRFDAIQGCTYRIEQFTEEFESGSMELVDILVWDDQGDVLASFNGPGQSWWTATKSGPVYLSIWATMSAVESYDVSVTVSNHPPIATPQSKTTAEDTAVEITLAGTDADGQALTYAIATAPGHGTLSAITGNQLTYTPTLGYVGEDSFTFTASDGTATSVPAAISITVDPAIYTLTYTAGANGTITGTSPQTVNHGASGTSVTAVADSGYHFVSWSDGNTNATRTDSNVTANRSVTASFAITPVNRSPVASAVSVTTSQDAAVQVSLQATDADGDSLTYTVVHGPSHGNLAAVSGNKITYVPASGYVGSDSFTFRAYDGAAYSNTAIVSIAVNATGGATATVPVGGNVTVTAGQATVSFPTVTSSGSVSVTPYSPRREAPSNFRLLPNLYFDIHPTATFEGLATVTLNVPSAYSGDITKLKVFHWKDSGWDVITPTVDVAARTVTFQTATFSDFGVGEPSAQIPVVSTPASSSWSLALAVLVGIAVVARRRRVAPE